MHDHARLRLVVRGAVQGVGFRPFVYRLAAEMGLTGWVNNGAHGVFIEVEGEPTRLREFLLRIEAEKPPLAIIQSLEHSVLDPVGFTTFEIRHSDDAGAKTALILPDIATCPDCLREIRDPADRRHHYPFTNCTNCGPRFTIIEALPYDRSQTTMRHFAMCPACRAEYTDPADRRFHAQPNACPACGPHLELWDERGSVLETGDEALSGAAEAIRRGAILALKGLGGFHLVVDARDQAAVLRLRARKRREEKALALMYPSLAQIEADCQVSALEARLLRSPEAPILLLRRRGDAAMRVAPAVAPGNPYLGVMLPYTPLHHLLMDALEFPIVATSGNLSDEPICIDEHEALDRLGGIADVFLVHNRPIRRHVDDSILRVVLDRELVVRRARGFAPLPIRLDRAAPAPILALGAHLKNTVAAAVERDVFVSQHIGDLETAAAYEAFRQVIADFMNLYDLRPVCIACDLHPDYLSTQYAAQLAEQFGAPLVRVQHHYAHVLACMAENLLNLDGPVLGVSWDGTGYGSDGTVWGGEFLVATGDSFRRLAHLRTFRLPGGEAAVREPRRSAIGLLYAIYGEALFTMDDLAPLAAFSAQECGILRGMLDKGLNAPLTSSAGRLFDAVAALVGLRQRLSFEGQAAMELEFMATAAAATDECYPFAVTEITGADLSNGAMVNLDWEAAVRAVLDDVRRRLPAPTIAVKFHNTLVEMIIATARRAGLERVVLTGGVFQNKYLLERSVYRLRAEGFRPYWHQRIPPNDGGIALGQVIAALRQLQE